MAWYNFWRDGKNIVPGTDPAINGEDESHGQADIVGSITRACVDIIVSRAVNVMFTGTGITDGSRPNRPAGPWGAREFYHEMLENLLFTGYAVAWQDNMGHFHPALVGNGGSQFVDAYGPNMKGSWNIKTGRRSMLPTMVPEDDVLLFTLRPQKGSDTYQPDNLLEEIRSAVYLYEMAMLHQTDYSDRASKIGMVFQTDKTTNSPEKVQNIMDKVQKKLTSSRRSYMPMTLPEWLKIENGPQPYAPVKGSIEYAAAAISRFYGVPLSLLGVEEPGRSADVDRTEAALLLNAVFPVLDRLCAGWTKMLEKDISYDPLKLSKPTMGARMHHAKSMGQVGAFTVNEIRDLMGYKPIEGPEGEKLASSAGGPDHDKDGAMPEKKNSDQ